MARKKNNICISCHTVFRGRADKKTCSERCRKRIQRVKSALGHEAEVIKETAGEVFHTLENVVEPSYVTEEGFIGDIPVAVPPANSQTGVLQTSRPAAATVPGEPTQPVSTRVTNDATPSKPAPLDQATTLALAPSGLVGAQAVSAAAPQVAPGSLLTASAPVPAPAPISAPLPLFTAQARPPEELLVNTIPTEETKTALVSDNTARKLWTVRRQSVVVLATVAVTILALSFFVSARHRASNLNNITNKIPTQNVAVTGGSLKEPSPIQLQNNSDVLIVNGDLYTRGNLRLYGQQYFAQFQANNLSSNRTLSLPDKSGTVCLDSNNCNFATAAQLNQVAQNTNGVRLQGSTPGTPDVGNVNISGVAVAGSFSGNGANITHVNASNISTGTISDSRLSGNVALLNANQTFSGSNIFSSAILAPSLQASGASLAIGSSATPLNLAGNLTSTLKVTDSGNDVTLGFSGTPTGAVNYNFNAAAAPGTYTVCTTVGNCAGSGGGDILNNGNSFGSDVTLGTNDNFGLNLETNNTTVASFSNSGAALFKNASDSTAAFQVQNASAGKDVLSVDSSNGKVILGNPGASGITGLAQFNYSGQTGSISLNPINPSSTAYTLNLPAENGTLCSTGSVCSGYQAAGSAANTALSNLSSVAINTSLLAGSDNTIDLGDSGTKSFRTGYFDTSVLGPLFDVQSAGSLSVGTATATTINLGSVGSTVKSTAVHIGDTTDVTNDQTVTIGSKAKATDITTIQGGGAASTIVLQTAASGGIDIGVNDVASKTINVGSVGSTAQNTTIHVGDSSAGIQSLTIGSTSSSSGLTLQSGSGNTLINATAGTVTLQTTTSGVINIKPASVDGTNVVIGTSDNVGTLLVLDTKTGNGDPSTCTSGGMYYNSNSGLFRACQNGSWANMISAVNIANYTSGDTNSWAKPTGISAVEVILVGAGGGGGGGSSRASSNERDGGGGGGGGAYSSKIFVASDLTGGNYNVAVGTGGTAGSTGGSGANGGSGGAGGNTCFSTSASCGGTVYLVAYGGGGGEGGGNAADKGGGGGGGGTAGAGGSGSSGTGAGGNPMGYGQYVSGGSGGPGGTNGGGGDAEYGGGGGGIGSATGRAGVNAGSSLHGGGGGGSGAGIDASDVAIASTAGGASQSYSNGGGGSAGTSGAACTNNSGTGTTGTSIKSGSGGGGGGASTGSNNAGCPGGAGGQSGGGGGGGGAGTNTQGGGIGGSGGAGKAWIISW